MQVVLFSSPGPVENEIAVLNQILKDDSTIFHLRKEHYTEDQISQILDSIDEDILKRTVLHGHFDLAVNYPVKGIHLTEVNRAKYLSGALEIPENLSIISSSFHSVDDLLSSQLNLEYAFLSPIFNSISKEGYQSGFDHKSLKISLEKSNTPVIALGGLSFENVSSAHEMGFHGVAVLGSVWMSPDPVQAMQNILDEASKFV